MVRRMSRSGLWRAGVAVIVTGRPRCGESVNASVPIAPVILLVTATVAG
jgi:hypothetical protein